MFSERAPKTTEHGKCLLAERSSTLELKDNSFMATCMICDSTMRSCISLNLLIY